MNYKETVRKIHNNGWKNSHHTSDDVSMLVYVYGVSMYPQFFVEYLKIYLMLPRPYIRSFNGGPANQVFKKNGC